jgi:hypothetical protein
MQNSVRLVPPIGCECSAAPFLPTLVCSPVHSIDPERFEGAVAVAVISSFDVDDHRHEQGLEQRLEEHVGLAV